MELINFTTDDNLILHGLFIPPQDENPTLIYLHGWEGNFYQNSFIATIAEKLSDKGYGFLTLRTRSSDLISELPTVEGSWQPSGSWIQKLEEAHLDISGAIDFLKKQGLSSFILAGHSLGTMKCVRYLFEGKYAAEISKLVLISPFDNSFIKYAGSEDEQIRKLEEAELIIASGKGTEMVPEGFTYTKMSWQTFASWGKMDDFGKMWWFSNPDYTHPILEKIALPVKTVIGSVDEYVTNAKQTMATLKRHIKDFDFRIVKNALHSYLNHEEELASVIWEMLEKEKK